MKKSILLLFSFLIGFGNAQTIYTETVKYTIQTSLSNEENVLLSYELPEHSSGYIDMLILAKDAQSNLVFTKKIIVFDDSLNIVLSNTKDSVYSPANVGAEISTAISDNIFYVPITAPDSAKTVIWQAIINVYINDTLIPPPPSGYDPDAQAYFDAIGDVPESAKQAYSDLIVEFKNIGVWSNPNFWAIIATPTRDAFKTLIELKSLTTVSSFYNTAVLSAPYNDARRCYPSLNGWKFRDTGHIRTGFIPSDKMTANDFCTWRITYKSEPTAGTWNDGSSNSITQVQEFSTNLTGGIAVAIANGTTVGTGRLNATNSGAGAVYLVNRRSATYMSLGKDTSLLGSISGTQGDLPTVEIYLNGVNNNGVSAARRNSSPIIGWGSTGGGLTALQETAIKTALFNFVNDMQWNISHATKNVVIDGNSHTTFWLAAIERNLGYDLFGDNWTLSNVGVSGQTTAQMNTSYSANIAPLYSSSYSENILIPFEVTNHYHITGNVATTKSAFQTYVTNAHATGYEVVAPYIMCRNYVGNSAGVNQTNYNLTVDSLNQWLLSGASGADYFITPDPNYFIWRSAYASNTAYNTAVSALLTNSTYFYDQVHRSEFGYQQWAAQISELLLSL